MTVVRSNAFSGGGAQSLVGLTARPNDTPVATTDGPWFFICGRLFLGFPFFTGFVSCLRWCVSSLVAYIYASVVVVIFFTVPSFLLNCCSFFFWSGGCSIVWRRFFALSSLLISGRSVAKVCSFLFLLVALFCWFVYVVYLPLVVLLFMQFHGCWRNGSH